MGKRSHKLPSPSGKNNAGCLSVLINIFDFGLRHQKKLLPDGKHASDKILGTGYARSKLDLVANSEIKHEETDDVDKSRGKRVSLDLTSVKTLMEEEMSRRQTPKVPSDESERLRSDHETHFEKNHKKTSKESNAVSNINVNELRVSANLNSIESRSMNLTETSSIAFDLAAFMLEFYSNNHHYQEKHADSKTESCPPLRTIGHKEHDQLDEPDAQLAQKQSMLQKALGDVAEIFMSQKVGDVEQLKSNGQVQSQEFMDALEILSLNKELFMKLCQDPNSILLKHIQHLQNAQIGSELLGEEIGSSGQHEESISHEQFGKQNRRNFFRKKDKSKGTEQSNSSQSINKIIVLKPSKLKKEDTSVTLSLSSLPRSRHSSKDEEDNDRDVSFFSLKDVKRKLRHAIGESRKERHFISMDGFLNILPFGFKDSGDMGEKSGRDTKEASQTSAIAKRRDKKSKPKGGSAKDSSHERLNMTTVAHTSQGESISHEEARKHLTKMLPTGDDKDSSSIKKVLISLESILALPEYFLSPRSSPGREKELDLPPPQMTFSPSRKINQENPTDDLSLSSRNLKSSPCTDTNADDKMQRINSNPLCVGEDLMPKGSMKTVEIAGAIPMQQGNYFTAASISTGNEPDVICERCKEEGSSTPVGLGIANEKPRLVIPSESISPSFLLIQRLEDPEGTMEKPERPSPVSVLEPFFSDDVISQGCTTTDHDDFPSEPLQIHFTEHYSSFAVPTSSDSESDLRPCFNDKEAMLLYVRTLLEASGLSWNEISERCHTSDQLLDPSLLDEVGISNSRLPDDPMPLFDFVNEILVEIQGRLFGCTPWLSLIKHDARPMLIGGKLVQEACNNIDRHLQSEFPPTLNQITGKDMEHANWMEHRFETEAVVFEVGDSILEEIIEETLVRVQMYTQC